MGETEVLLRRMYAAFNRRDIDGAFVGMAEAVDWPKASEGGRAVGKQAIRAYWTRQWSEFDPTVEPVEVAEREDGRVEVRVHQVVKDREGRVLSDGVVRHVYALRDGLIERMEVMEGEGTFGR